MALAEQLLEEIELSKIGPGDVARKASRLARLLDDVDASQWLQYEITGFPRDELDASSTAAARRSNRMVRPEDQPSDSEGPMFNTGSLGQISVLIDSARARLVSGSSPAERNGTMQVIQSLSGVLDAVVGSIHLYVGERYQELRFGSTVESAFEVVRKEVDSSIGGLVPSALPMLSSAFDNATSANPEDWASAAGTCRRLLKAVADEVRPPGDDVKGRKMGDGNYINRLIDWIEKNTASDTEAKLVTGDLAYLGERLDAADGAGQKGAHAQVDRFEASRFITGTYLVLGDVLRLSQKTADADAAAGEAETNEIAEAGSSGSSPSPRT